MVRFDEALAVALKILKAKFPVSPPETIIVRDPSGALSIVLQDSALTSKPEWSELASQLHGALGKYSPGVSRVLLGRSDLVDPSDIIDSPYRVRLAEDSRIGLVDRLLTNQDWLRVPILPISPIPTATAFSIKGGVGRSTAIAVLAWHLARLGRRVLVVDLDLEAPGIGPMLLPELSDFGVVDWCVEAIAGQADDDIFSRMGQSAPLAEGTDGDIVVIPAFGNLTQDYVAKLGRVYLPSYDESGVIRGLADRLAALLKQAAVQREPPDVVLLDSRAGLHDIGSAVVTQLGAEVFLFARNEEQTWASYLRLFEHLRLARSIHWGMPDDDLRWRLKMVAAQSEPTRSSIDSFIDRSYSTWTLLYDLEDNGEVKEQKTNIFETNIFERDDEEAPHYPLAIAFDPRVRTLNLVDPLQRPDWTFVRTAFGPFLDGATDRLFPPTTDSTAETPT